MCYFRNSHTSLVWVQGWFCLSHTSLGRVHPCYQCWYKAQAYIPDQRWSLPSQMWADLHSLTFVGTLDCNYIQWNQLGSWLRIQWCAFTQHTESTLLFSGHFRLTNTTLATFVDKKNEPYRHTVSMHRGMHQKKKPLIHYLWADMSLLFIT